MAPDGPLRCDLVQLDAVTAVQPHGDVDLANVHDLRAALDRALRRDAPLVADLTAVTYIDRSGVSLLLETYRQCRRGCRPFAVIVAPSTTVVRRVFSVFSLIEEEFQVFWSRDEARDHFAKLAVGAPDPGV